MSLICKILTCLLTVMGISACGTVAQPDWEFSGEDAEPEQIAFDQQTYDHGVNVYLDAYCGVCHQLDAAASRGEFGPDLSLIAAVAPARYNDPNYSGSATDATAYILESILYPKEYFVPTYAASAHAMPAFTHLSETDLDALLYMLSQQK